MGLGVVDIVLLSLSLIITAIIGIYHALKGIRSTPTDYMLGGRMMGALPLAMSLTVGTISAITIMTNAGEMYANGTQLWIMDLGIALGMIVVAKVFIPIFYHLQSVSLYHYIERRFQSKWLRKLTVIVTLIGACLFLGFLLYPPSFFIKTLTKASRNDTTTETTNIIITGLVCTLYSSFGGVKAVVYTDVVQSLIMIIGVLAIVIQGSYRVGGLSVAWDIAYHRQRIEFFNFDFNPYQRHSFWLVIVYGFFFALSTFGANQNQTQRAFSASSVREAKLVIYYSIIGILLLKGLINLSGIVMYANFVECDSIVPMPPKDLIAIVVYVSVFLTKLPGLAGLFVASIYAAVLSSYSTQVNSITALLWEDFLKEIRYFQQWSEIKIARLQKLIAFTIGLLGIAMGFVVASIKSGSFLTALLQVTGAIWGPIVGLFLVAVFGPWVKLPGATMGFLLGIVVSVWVVLGQILTQPSTQYLSLEKPGCDNATDSVDSIFLFNNTSSDLNIGEGFYGISYCLNHCWGALTCICVALLSIFITKSNTPEDVEEALIHPSIWKYFTKFPKIKLCC